MACLEPTIKLRILMDARITKKYLIRRNLVTNYGLLKNKSSAKHSRNFIASVSVNNIVAHNDKMLENLANRKNLSTNNNYLKNVSTKRNDAKDIDGKNHNKDIKIKRTYGTNLAVNKSEKSLDLTHIPTPKGIPFLGTTFSQILAGSSPQLHWYIDRRHKELGPIFREKIGPVDCVFLSDPDGMRSVFAQEGKYPLHILPPAWITYNNIHGISRGLFFMNGDEWLHFRRIMNDCLLKGDSSWLEDSCRPAVENLLSKIEKSVQNEETFENLEEHLYRWSLDVMLSILLGPDQFKRSEHILDEHLQELASTVHLIFETSSKLQLISPEFAAALKIPRWRRFEATVTRALNSTKHLLKLLSDKKYHDSNGLLAKFRSNMSEEELIKIVADLILAAGDTTAYSMEWMLYLMGKNGCVQKRLREELIESSRKQEKELSIPLLKNILKETLRMYPVAPFLTRILPQPSKIMGYHCPANTVVILSIFSTGRDEKYFRNPLHFLPERWFTREGRNSIVQNSNLPFAIGARSCIGKRLAEIQMQLTLTEIVKRFQFTVENSQDVNVIMKMVAVPSCPIKFKFHSL